MERLTNKLCKDDVLDAQKEPRLKSQAETWLRLCQLEDILGDTYDLDRLRELVEADKDGRCVVLPCKPSDTTVYQILGKKHARGPAVKMRHVYCATVWSGGRYQLEHQGMTPCRGNELGKTWFLDEEAAEAALAKEADHE